MMRGFQQIEIAAADGALLGTTFTVGLRLRQVPGLAVTRAVPAPQVRVSSKELQRRIASGVPDPARAWTITLLLTGESLNVYFATAVQAGRFALLLRAQGVNWRRLLYDGLTVARAYRRAFNKAIKHGPPALNWNGHRAEVLHA
jgi:hypothetical protein